MIHKFSRYLLTLVALLAMTTGAWADGGTYTVQFKGNGKTKTYENVALPATFDMVGGTHDGELNKILHEFYGITSGWEAMGGFISATAEQTAVTVGKYSGTHLQWIKIGAPFEGSITVTGRYYQSAPTSGEFTYSLEISIPGYVGPLAEVEFNNDKTEASFDMPACDATLEYDIVRNLASNMTLNLLIGTDAVTADARLRIAKNAQTGKYAPVSALSFTLTDAPEGGETTTLTAAQALAAKLNPVFYLQGENDTWTAVKAENIDAETHLPQNLAVGQVYRLTLVAADDAPLYGGETLPSFAITLFEGYEVEVAAGEYATFYKDEALTLDAEETAAKIYTITAVGETTATATELTVAKANMPILVKNTSEETKTILLIPTTDAATEVDAAAEFIGTLEATTIAASTAELTNYALNGKQFVWVKDAIEVAANKAWLAIPTGANARALTIVFGDTTRIKGTDFTDYTDGVFYDLNGRKLQSIPTRKGIYILNGRKVVVK